MALCPGRGGPYMMFRFRARVGVKEGCITVVEQVETE